MSNQITITGGAKVRNLEGVLTGTAGLVGALPINVANGIPQLDSSGKILVSQLPNSVMEFLGTWNAATNTPTLANGTGNAGDVYLCNVAGTVNFGAGPIAFSVGDYVVYSGSTWERSGGAVGTVTSVGLTESGDSLTITGSPVTTSGTINIGFAGTNLQYINGAGNLTTFPTLITSIGLSMPSAFSVANSPLTANGTIAVTGAGTASQYIRGDGQLATMPSTGGGGSAVYYYLNGSVNASVAGYKQMSNTAVVGTGTDFSLVGNGLIAEFLTDAGNPNRLQIPSGAWNFEMFFSMSSSGGNQKFYLDLLKYNGSTFTLIASTSLNPEEITGGTTTDLYITSMAVPETTLLVTDRLALRVYIVDNSSGRTSTLHTENGNLCQIVTTFSAGVTSLNGLTANTQYLAVGTGGTDFNINSLVDTHTFNLPTASATNRGALSSADWTLFNGKQDNLTFYSPLVKSGVSVTIPQATGSVDGFLDSADWTTFNNKVPYTGATANVDLGFKSLFAGRLTISGVSAGGAGGLQFYRTNNFEIPSFDGISTIDAISNNFRFAIGIGTSLYKDFQFNAGSLTNNTTRTYTLPDASGTLALTSNLTSFITLTSLSATSPLAYNNTTGAFSIQVATTSQNGYLSSTDWTNFQLAYNSRLRVIYAPLNFDSGTGSLTINQASSITNGFLSSIDWNTFNGKQNALTNPVTGTGTTNYIPKFTGASTIGNSIIQDNSSYIYVNGAASINGGVEVLNGWGININNIGNSSFWKQNNNSGTYELKYNSSAVALSVYSDNNVGIGTTTNAGYKLDVNGTGRFSGAVRSSSYFQSNDGTRDFYFNPSANFGSGDLPTIQVASNHALQFATNNTLRLTIASTGAATFSSSVTATTMTLNSVGGDAVALTLSGDGSGNSAIKGGGGNLDLWSPGGDVTLRYNNSGGIKTIGLVVKNSTGNVGIGTSNNLSSKLVVNGGLGIGNNWGVSGATMDINADATGSNGASLSVSYWSGSYGPMIFKTSEVERMRITSGGNLLVGTTTDSGLKFQVQGEVYSKGDSAALFVQARDLSIYYGFYASSNTQLNFWSSSGGNVGNFNRLTGIYTPTSDINKKKDFEVSTIGLNAILGLKPTLFRMNGEDENAPKTLGFIAQEVKPFIPQAYVESEDFIGLNDRPIIAALVKAVQELKQELNELKNK